MTELEWGGDHPHARIAQRGCILRTVVGSQVHGVTRAGTDDRDEMAITIEPPEYAIGLHDFKHWSYRTQPEGVQSGPGDLDLIVYSLRRFCHLAMKGSPTVLLPLFAPRDQTLICTELGEELRDQADQFITPAAKESFIGYLKSQRSHLVAGSGGHGRARERELSEAHGYDTKLGIELLEDSRITLPVPEPERSRLMEVRMGTVPLSDILDELDSLVARLENTYAIEYTTPSELTIERWLVSAYQRHWSETWTPTWLE